MLYVLFSFYSFHYFLPGFNSEKVAVALMGILLMALDENQASVQIKLVLLAAFNTIGHEVLMICIQFLGSVYCVAFRLLLSYPQRV